MNKLKAWMMEEESGQGLVEYALIIVLVAIAVIGGLKALTTEINGAFSRISTALS